MQIDVSDLFKNIDPSTYQRMDDLSNIKILKSMLDVINLMVEDQYKDGFNMDDIINFINLKIIFDQVERDRISINLQ